MRGWFGARACGFTATLALAFISGCGGGGGVDPRPPEILPASWSLDEADARRGEARVVFSVDVDPRAGDVDVIDGVCGVRSLGHGMWTRNRLVWWLGTDEVARALECGGAIALVARTHAPVTREERAQRVRVQRGSVAGVRIDADFGRHDIDAVSLETTDKGTVIKVQSASPESFRLSVMGSLFGVTEVEESVATFVIPTRLVVDASLRSDVIRIAGAGDRWAYAYPQLFIDGQVVRDVDDQPSLSEGEQESESEDRG